MYKDIKQLNSSEPPATYVFCAGFEQRVTRASDLLWGYGIRAARVAILKYEGKEHQANLDHLRQSAKRLAPRECVEISVMDNEAFKLFLAELNPEVGSIVIDITGLSRVAMMAILSMVYDARIRCVVIYTEASEYYPTKEHFDALTKSGNALPEEAFLRLSKYEKDEIVYSSHCDVEEIEGLNGRMLPSYPLMLIAFLTFKRGRVSAILQAYEANVRVLIKSVPVRADLSWRADAIVVPNCDLLEDGAIKELETLDWMATYRFLSELYESSNNKYKFNFILAPLGSKMQTVGAWLFAKERRDVKVVTSTPKKLFYERYSVGFGQTFVVDNLPRKG